jgi:hypothetical protein
LWKVWLAAFWAAGVKLAAVISLVSSASLCGWHFRLLVSDYLVKFGVDGTAGRNYVLSQDDGDARGHRHLLEGVV